MGGWRTSSGAELLALTLSSEAWKVRLLWVPWGGALHGPRAAAGATEGEALRA